MLRKLILTVVLLMIIAPIYARALDMDGLVLYFPLDEGKGEVAGDASGTGNDGELQGNVEWVDAKHGKGVKISDDAAGNTILVKDSDSLDITDELSIAMWVNLESLSGSCAIITKADTYMIHASDWSGNGIEQELLLWPFDSWKTPASTPIQFGEWRHVAGVYDGSKIKMYIDGELMCERARKGKIAVTNSDLVIGRDNRGCCNTRVFGLTVDDVMIFSRALSDSEVKEAMSSLTPVQPYDHLASVWAKVKSEI